MNKLVLALALATLGSLAQAQESFPINHSNDKYFDVSVGYTYSKTTDNNNNGDTKGDTYGFFPTSRTTKGDGINLGWSYTTFQNENIFLQPSIQYITTGNRDSDKYVVGKLNVGYRFDLNSNIVQSVSPKVGIGAYHDKFNGGSSNGVTYGAGVEFGLTDKASVEVGYNYMKGNKSGSHADLTTVALKYKF